MSSSASSTTVHDLFTKSEEHGALRDMVRQFTADHVEPQAQEYDRAETFNRELFNQCGELGLLGLTVSEEYGGSGMDAAAACVVHEELSYSDPGFCLAYLAHSLLFVNNLAVNGTEEQKKKFLPRVCTGEIIGGMGMSEPAVGTDVLGLTTKAVKDGDDWILNGQKMWITNGCVDDTTLGDVFLIYARTSESATGISLFLVEKGMEGFSLGQRIKDKLGMRASGTAELVFEDVRLPAENLVGEVNGAVSCMMRNLEIERVGLAAMSVGIARRCVDVMNVYAKDRKAFGHPLNAFGQIQRHVGESYAKYMAAKCYTYNVANCLDLNATGNRLETDGVKLFASTMGKEVADSAIQALGGYGYVGDYKVERLWRDAKLLEIGGGTVESHHKNMVRELARADSPLP